MSVKGQILDGLGQGYTAQVGPNNALLVQVLPDTSKGVPPADLTALRQLREFFTNPALGDPINQRVNATLAAPVEFSVLASSGLTKWITSFRLNIESQTVQLNSAEFRSYGATVAGLTNGVQIEAVQSGVTTNIASEPVRIIGDYLNYSDNAGINFVNALTTTMDFLQFTFTFDKPVVLAEGSSDRLTIRIRDNLVAALTSGGAPAGVPARQYAIASGYQEFA